MYQIIIVDDEPKIASGIALLLRHSHTVPCCVAGIARDGEEGLRLAQKLRPDIVLTEIRIPKCDGLEMIRRIRESGLTPEFLVLSGSTSFEHARKAMNLGVSNFLSKPLEEEELLSALTTACARIRKARDAQGAFAAIQRAILNLGLADYLTGAGRSDPEKLKEAFTRNGISPSDSSYMCWVVHTHEPAIDSLTARGLPDLAPLSGSIMVKIYSEYMAVVTPLHWDEAISFPEVLEAMRSVQSGTGPFCIGVGIPVSRFEEIPISLQTAVEACNRRLLNGQDQIIQFQDIQTDKRQADFLTPEEVRALEENFDLLNDENGVSLVRQICSRLRSREDLQVEDIRYICLQMIQYGFHRVLKDGVGPRAGQTIQLLVNKRRLAAIQNLDELEAAVIQVSRAMRTLMLESQVEDRSDVVEQASAYIRQNFCKAISLNDIAQRFYINPFYFSQLFKKRTGMNYQDYVISLRMERAKTLLAETNMKVSDVRSAVGYSDANHFNRLFTDATGLTPSAWRKQNREKHSSAVSADEASAE